MSERAFPELKGSDRVWETCGKCGGDKVVHWGNVTYSNGAGEARWCFDCDGLGGKYVLVSSIRAREARQRKAAQEAEDRHLRAEQAAAEEKARAEVRAAQRAAEKAAAEPVPTGREVITGQVLTMRYEENRYGYGGSYKWLVLDDRGFKVWGTSPARLEVSRGDRVRFTATVEPSSDDDRFGFAKRPTGAEVIEGVAA